MNRTTGPMRKNNDTNLLKKRHEWINQIGYRPRRNDTTCHEDVAKMVPISDHSDKDCLLYMKNESCKENKHSKYTHPNMRESMQED